MDTGDTEHMDAPYNPSRMRKPPITIKCDCGETRDVSYGERWRCERCGRSWNTQQIPAEEYEGLLRRVRRHKLEVLAMAAIGAAVLIPLIVVVSPGFILLVPMAMIAWLFLVLPVWRRRYRRTARDAPRWELHPE
jgi:Flp pilus assembly protein TadB